MKRRHVMVLALASVATLAVAGWAVLWPSGAYPTTGTVTRIEVTTPQDRPITTINDPAVIQHFVAYMDARRHGWGGLNDAFGVPVPSVVAKLYSGTALSGHVGVGDGFLEAQRDGGFASKGISGIEEQEFLTILGVPSSAVRR